MRRIDPVIWLEAGLAADCLPDVRAQVQDALGALEQVLMPAPSNNRRRYSGLIPCALMTPLQRASSDLM